MLRIGRRLTLLAGLAILGAIAPFAAGSPSAEPSLARPLAASVASAATVHSDCRKQFDVVPSASPALDTLYGVSGLAADDVWAVGESQDAGRAAQPIIEHWDGAAWSVTPSPVPPRPSVLFDVEPIAPDDVWAVGTQLVAGGVTQTLAMHWDGVAWSIVPTPNVGSANNFLYSVAASAPGDVWAVGTTANASAALVLHWDGAVWSIVRTPDTLALMAGILNDVAVVAPDDVWAVGMKLDAAQSSHALVEHWDGAAWSIVPSPSSSGAWSQLLGLAARNGKDMLAVGFTGTYPSFQTLAERWDGRAWTMVEIEDASNAANILRDVAFVTNNDAWAVGYTQTASGVKSAMVEHWDGQRWRLADTPVSLVPGTFLNSVALAGKRSVWAVGGVESVTGPPFTAATLTQRLCKGATPG